MRFLPDQTGQVELVEKWIFQKVKEELGCDPLFLSCHLCFAHMFHDDVLQKFLLLPYSELYTALANRARSAAADIDSRPPNFHTLLKAATAKAQG